MTWSIYDVIAEHAFPAIYHSGHSGIGGGLRLEYSQPICRDDVAID